MLTSLKPKKVVDALDEASALDDYAKIQKALDDLALSLPDGFHWSRELRRTYDRATKAVGRLKAQVKKNPARVI